MVDQAKLDKFIGQLLSDLGGAASVPMVRIGDALGLYKALCAGGPMTSKELADKVGVNERYLREWLAHQAASNYLSYDADTRRFTLPEEQAMVFAVEDSPVYMMGGFDLMGALTGKSAEGGSGFSDRCRRGVGRSDGVHVLRRRALFSPGVPQQPDQYMAPRARRGCR